MFSLFVMVYGDLVLLLLCEDMVIGYLINFYGMLKFMVEYMFSDFYVLDNEWNIVLFCYFNLVGVYEFG